MGIDQSLLSRYFLNADLQYPFYEGNWTTGADSGLYNRLGRGYPDVAAVADNIALWYGGKFGHTGGTSASENLFGQILRINHDKPDAGYRYSDICRYN